MPGASAHTANATAAMTEPTPMTKAELKRSRARPAAGATKPPASSASEKKPNTAVRLWPVSAAIAGASTP